MFWLPEVSPGTIILDAAPDGFEPVLPLDISRLGSLAAEVTERNERELVVFGSPDELHIRLRAAEAKVAAPTAATTA